jgi:hypothetical protein
MKVSAERRLGLTFVFKHIAQYYLSLGYGVYHPANHPHYDCIVVRELYPFMENPLIEGECAAGVIVEFFQGSQRVKYVEFRCQVVGGGGESVAQSV